MKRFAFVLLLAATAVLVARPADDDLVASAKAAKEKRKKSTTKVITNADVKKAKGKVVEREATPAPETPATPSLSEQYESGYRDRLVADTTRAAARKRVEDLEKALAAIEQSYYEENDLDKRDKEITKKFETVKKELEEAKAAAPPKP